MDAENLSLARLVGEPFWGDVVLRYDEENDMFFIYPLRFNKYGIREVEGWGWVTDRWQLPADADTIEVLAEEYPDTLVIDDSAVEIVIELLGYDPCDRERGQPTLSGFVSTLTLPESEPELLDQPVRQEDWQADQDDVEEEEDSITHLGQLTTILSDMLTVFRDQNIFWREQIESTNSTLRQLVESESSSSALLRLAIGQLESIAARVDAIQSGDDEHENTLPRASTPSLDSIKAELSERLNTLDDFSVETQLILIEMWRTRHFLDAQTMLDWSPLVTYCNSVLEREAESWIHARVISAARSSPGQIYFADRRLARALGKIPASGRTFNDLLYLLRRLSAPSQDTDPQEREKVAKIFESAFPGKATALDDLHREIEPYVQDYRNPAAHQGLLSRGQAELAISEVLGTPGLPERHEPIGLLNMIVGIAQDLSTE